MIKLYNSLTRKIEEFKSIKPNKVGMYTCGPTVYDFATIGNFRTNTMADILVRVLEYNGYDVKYVMNITDVGHLTDDADQGEDKMEKGAKREGKSAWDIAKFYTDAFFRDFKKLNLKEPFIFARATDHIAEQIALIQLLEKNGFTYKISDGIYFDTSKFPNYGKLSDLDQIKEGARVEVNPEKKNARDFALWKFSDSASRRQMEWDSPWGKGFPGWHIECSAMGMKYLGETFDIHTGGIDLRSTHHPNEIAQSEAASGNPFVHYWIHGAFMLIDGKRMSKSLGNNYKIADLIEKGFNPLSLRYLYLTTHYRQEMNFTFEGLEGAQNALNRLYEEASKLEKPEGKCEEWENKFLEAINDDLNMPQALAVVWELMKSDQPSGAKLASLLKFDQVLGLEIQNQKSKIKNQKSDAEIPEEVQNLVQEREVLRKQKKFHLADGIRARVKKMGYEIFDVDGKSEIKKI